MRTHYLKFFVLGLFFAFAYACSSDDEPDNPDMNDPDMMSDECEGEDVSYANDIAPIVNNACALSGCHVEGFSSGDFTAYAGLKNKADGALNTRVVISKDMPPSNSSGPTSLTEAQILAFKCWIEAGAPDN